MMWTDDVTIQNPSGASTKPKYLPMIFWGHM